MVAYPNSRNSTYIRGLLPIIVLGSAVAAFGLTLHYFGHSHSVPDASKQFGFWALFPIAIIDRIYDLFTSAARFPWNPTIMFIVMWVSYFTGAYILTFKIILRKQFD